MHRTHAHALDVPVAHERFEALDFGEVGTALQRLDRVLELQDRRHVTDKDATRTQRTRHHVERAARFRQIDEEPIDAGLIEAFIQIAQLDGPVGRFAEKRRDVAPRRRREILAQFVGDETAGRPDGPQQRDRERARADAALDHGRSRIDVAPYQQRAGILWIDHLRGARQMRNQVGVGRPQDEIILAGAEFHARTFLEAIEALGGEIAANLELLPAPQNFQIAAALAIDEEYGVVFFK